MINHLIRIVLLSVVFALPVFVLCDATTGQPTSQPNIIFILADDLGIGDIGVYNQNRRAELGLPAISTPNIDSLANNGMRFTRMYSCPMCSASRSTLHNGFHQGHGKVDRNVGKDNPIQPGNYETTFAQILQKAGYTTGIFGAWNLHGFNVNTGTIVDIDSTPFGKGYDRLWCNAIGDGYRSFFAIVDDSDSNGTFENSDISVVPRPNALNPNDLWAIENGGLGIAKQYEITTTTNEAIEFIDKSLEIGNPFLLTFTIFGVHSHTNSVPNQGIYKNLDGIDDADKNYAASVGQIDLAVGRLLNKLFDPNGDGGRSDSILENTIIVFSSDNGNQSTSHDIDTFGSTVFYDQQTKTFVDLRGEKRHTLEGGIRAPFIVQWSANRAVVPGSDFEEMATFADWLPTVSDMVGEEPPLGIDGYSFWDDLVGSKSERPDFRIAVSAPRGGEWSIAMAGYKLFFDPIRNNSVLFHLPTNPEESKSKQILGRPDIETALRAIALAEGVQSDSSNFRDGNDYFCQFKNWTETTGENIHDPSNWSGGISHVEYDAGVTALNHLTGPASNWIATVANDTLAEKLARVSSDVRILAAEISAANAETTLLIDPARLLETRNELRIESGGHVALDDAKIQTIRDVVIRPGGKLSGHGIVQGYEQIISGIPEFQGQGLLEAKLINSGTVSPGRSESLQQVAIGNQDFDVDLDSTGMLTINGEYVQEQSGKLCVDLGGTDNSNLLDAEFDKLCVRDDVQLDGTLKISLVDDFVPSVDDVLEIIATDSSIIGEFNNVEINSSLSNLAAEVIYETDRVLISFSENRILIGDVNMDGVINLLDVAPFIELLSIGNFQAEADINGDGVVNLLDVIGFVALLSDA